MKRALLIGLLGAMGCAGSADASFDTANSNITTDGQCRYHVYKHSSTAWVQTDPRMSLVLWGSYWQSSFQANDFQSIWTSLFKTEILGHLVEYGIKSGTLDANYYLNNSTVDASASADDGGTTIVLDDTKIAGEINNEILAGSLPQPDDNTLYTILLPPNVITQVMITNGWAGYHGNSVYNGQRYTFSIIGYNSSDDYMDSVISHELYEASTNPDGHAWYDDGEAEGEVADLCVWQETTCGYYQVQKVWSQDLCGCL